MGTNLKLDRRFQVGLSADGAVFIRDREAKQSVISREFQKYALPMGSADTREEIESVVVYLCRLDKDNVRYRWPNFTEGSLEALEEAGALFERTLEEQRTRRKT